MSKKANPAFIGTFVIGAIVLVVSGILLFGSGRFFSRTETFVIFFNDTVNGLENGAPVKFMGVKIGQVKRIMIRLPNQRTDTDAIPVFIEVDMDRLREDLGVEVDLTEPEVFNRQVIDQGLRAQLQLQSFLTGLLYIELKYMDDPPPIARNIEGESRWREIPSMDSNIDVIFGQVEEALVTISAIDFKQIGQHTQSILQKLDEGIAQVQFGELNDAVLTAGKDLNALLTDPEIRKTLQEAQEALAQAKKLAANLDGKIHPLTEEIERALKAFEQTMAESQKTLASISDTVDPNAPLGYEARQTLAEVREAARAIKLLADYLERNPNALITGRKASDD